MLAAVAALPPLHVGARVWWHLQGSAQDRWRTIRLTRGDLQRSRRCQRRSCEPNPGQREDQITHFAKHTQIYWASAITMVAPAHFHWIHLKKSILWLYIPKNKKNRKSKHWFSAVKKQFNSHNSPYFLKKVDSQFYYQFHSPFFN